jgi:hypothetical protein
MPKPTPELTPKMTPEFTHKVARPTMYCFKVYTQSNNACQLQSFLPELTPDPLDHFAPDPKNVEVVEPPNGFLLFWAA